MKKPPKKKRSEKKRGTTCLRIQWGKLHTVNGEPHCPDCGKKAINILGFFGEPCWAHA